jgi:hypothetical protein
MGENILTRENRRTLREICPTPTLSVTTPTCRDVGLNLGLGGESSANTYMNYGRD